MNMGFLYGIAPTLDRIYKDPKDDALKKEAYQRAIAGETNEKAKWVLETILENAEVAEKEQKSTL